MSVGAAMSCATSSRLLNLQVARAQPAVNDSFRSALERGAFLRWDPLRSCAGLRASTSSSSSASCRHSSTSSRSFRRSVPRAGKQDSEDVDFELKEIDVEKGNQNGLAKLLNSAAKPALVAAMVALLAAQPSGEALAAGSGGRVGGKVFSKPAPSRSYSGGGSGGGGGRSYSGGGGGGYGGGYYAPPTYGLSPFGYSPFYGGGYGGSMFYGPSIGFGGGGAIFLAMIAFAALSTVARFFRNRFGNREEDDDRFDDFE